MPSNIFSETLLLFTTLSIISLLSLSLFNPIVTQGRYKVESNYLDGYRYGFRVIYLFYKDGYIYLENIGRDIEYISLLIIDGYIYNGSIETYQNNSWSASSYIPGETIFRIQYPYGGFERIDVVIEDRYILHVVRSI